MKQPKTTQVRLRRMGQGLLIAAILLLLEITLVACLGLQTRKPEDSGGPWVSIPGAPGCSAQLSVELDRTVVLPSQPVPVETTLRVRGPCSWEQEETNRLRDFILLIDWIDEAGNVVHLADEATYWEDMTKIEEDRYLVLTIDADHPRTRPLSLDTWFYVAPTRSDMYDISRPGTYRITLIRLYHSEPQRIPSNEVTFTRLPPLPNNEEIAGRPMPIPGCPDSRAQLQVVLGKQTFLPGEEIDIQATFLMHGSCGTWEIQRTNPFRDFILIIDRGDASGKVVPLANEDTYWRNALWEGGWPSYGPHTDMYFVDAEHPYTQTFPLTPWGEAAHAQADLYDVSAPGIYTLRLIYLGWYEPYYVPSNVVTFTRLP